MLEAMDTIFKKYTKINIDGKQRGYNNNTVFTHV